jgi:hypothetical protein
LHAILPVLLFEGCFILPDLAYQTQIDLVLVHLALLYCHMLVHIFVLLLYHLNLLHLLVTTWLLLEILMLYFDHSIMFRFVSAFTY